jgi:hypothetical protein
LPVSGRSGQGDGTNLMMPFPQTSKSIFWTAHAKAKMQFYKLSPMRIQRVLHSPKRIEEGIAPKTVAAMQPGSIKKIGQKETWSQEIWVMFQDSAKERKVISAWRYPGITKPRSIMTKNILRQEYQDYSAEKNKKGI